MSMRTKHKLSGTSPQELQKEMSLKSEVVSMHVLVLQHFSQLTLIHIQSWWKVNFVIGVTTMLFVACILVQILMILKLCISLMAANI